MINGILKIFVLSIIAVLLNVLVKNSKSSLSLYISIAAVLTVIFFTVNQLAPIVDFVKTVSNFINIDEMYLRIIVKALGISVMCEFSCNLCQDAGENSLSQSEVFGSYL